MSLVNLLLSRDRDLTESIRATLRSMGGSGLVVRSDFSEATQQLQRTDLVVAIAHIESDADADRVRGLLSDIRDFKQPLPLLVIDEPQVDRAHILELLRLGAVDCLDTPVDEQRLRFLIESLTLRPRFEYQKRTRTKSDPKLSAVTGPTSKASARFLVHSPAMREIVSQLRLIADRDSVVLLTGETGTGKTLLARFLHDESHRRAGPFVHMDCASVAENLIEAELFGHRKGAFTGADQRHEGKCAAARGGTLFLDEVDAISPAGQARLLRLTDEGVYSPVGSTEDVDLDARIVVATNRDLQADVAAGRFRQDLFHRLDIFNVELPPLRERVSEIRPLAEQFMAEAADRHGTPNPEVDDACWNLLEAYCWPGNIRELCNVIERIMAFHRGTQIGVENLPDALVRAATPSRESSPSASVAVDPSGIVNGEPHSATDSWVREHCPELTPLAVSRACGEVRMIVTALKSTDNNRTLAAQLLGVSREALYKKLRKYGLVNCDLNALEMHPSNAN